MLNRDPLVQELGRRLVAERGVAATPIVERFDVSKEIRDRFVPCRVTRTVHALVLQAVEETFGRSVDAPMSSRACRFCQICQDQRVQLANNVTLEATLNLLRGQSLGSPASDVRTRPGITPHTNHRDRPQGIIGGAIAAPVEPMSGRLSRGCFQRACAAERCQRSFAA
jgi:hypothetical protein